MKKAKGQGKGKSRGLTWTHDDTLAYSRGEAKEAAAAPAERASAARTPQTAGNIMKRRVWDNFAAKRPKGKGKGTRSFSFRKLHWGGRI